MDADADTRLRAMERLTPLVGEWDMDARFPRETADVPARTVFEWALDGRYLLQRAQVEHPAAPDLVAIIGAAPDGETYTQHYFDSRGVTRVYAMTFADGLWSLVRTTPDFSALDFSQRFTGRLDDEAATIRGRWETSRDGSTWEHDFELDYRRRARPTPGIAKVLGVIPVSDVDAVVAWYTRLFGRPADARPMPGLADWHVTDSGWVQVFRDVDRAGSGLLNLAVYDLEAHILELATRDIAVGAVTTTDKNARIAAVRDPEGNTISLIENPSV